MKKILFTLFLLLGCFSFATAQLYVGGSMGITSSKIDFGDADQSGTSFKILPEVGYQLSDRWAFGTTIGFMKGYAALGTFDPSDLKALGTAVVSTIADITSDDLLNADIKTFRIAPYARYSLLKKGDFEIFLDGMIAYDMLKVSGEADTGNLGIGSIEADEKVTGFEICVRPGVSYSLNDHFKLTARIGSLGYQQLKLKDSDFKLTRFGLDVDGSNLLFGLQYAF